MAPDTTDNKTRDAAHGAPGDTTAFVVTITEAARLLGQSVRTVQRALDGGKMEAVAVAGKRCVRLRADEVLPGLTPDEGAIIDGGAGFDLSANDARLSRVVSRDTTAGGERDMSTLAALVEALTALAPQPAGAHEIAAKLLLTLDECRVLTGLSRQALRSAIDGGDLKGRQIGRAWRVRRGDLESYIEGL
jgi:excisionase family DNA binding protein